MKYIIWGLGAVGTSFLHLLIENSYFIPSDFYCIDQSEQAKKRFILLGGLEENFVMEKITKDNIQTHLSWLEENDYLIDFTIDVRNLDVLQYCLSNGIHYFSTADSSWNPDPLWTSVHQHYLEYQKIKKNIDQCQNTCLIEFGMNPGMVSCFAKQCLKDIVTNDTHPYIRLRRRHLLKLLNEKKFGKVAKEIKLRYIQEIDNDDQEVSIHYEENVCYSPWNVWGYYYETISCPELALSGPRDFYSYKEIFDCDSWDFSLSLKKEGYKYKETTYSPQGKVTGHISTHEEIYTIRDIFTYGNYRPNVYFVYSPCEYAIRSVRNENIKEQHLITKEEIIKGGESVGIIMQGRRFHTHYFGNCLTTDARNESATILQVSASAYAGFVYMTKHKTEGLLFPEDVDEEKIMEIAKPYLKEYISVRYPKQKMSMGRKSNV